METLKTFAEKVKSDENLQNEIKKLSDANDQEGLTALVKSNGVSEEGIKHAGKAHMQNRENELNDDELDVIAGGNWYRETVNYPGARHCEREPL